MSVGQAGTRRRRTLAVAVACATSATGLVLASGSASQAVPAAPTSTATGSTMGKPTPRSLAAVTVGTFNTHKGSSALPNSGARLDRVAGEIVRGKYDVVGLQETNTERRNALQARLNATHNHSYLGDPRDKHSTAGQIFYRRDSLIPGDHAGYFELAKSPGNPRSGLYQDFTDRATGVRFMFVTTHLFSGTGQSAADLRRAQTIDLLNGIEKANYERLPVIYVGDMNSHHGSKYVYDAPRNEFAARGITDTIGRSGKVKFANYNTFNRLQKKIKKGGFRPDQIYTTAEVEVANWKNMARMSVKKRVIKKKNGKRKVKKIRTNRVPFASDHNAVRATVIIPGG